MNPLHSLRSRGTDSLRADEAARLGRRIMLTTDELDSQLARYAAHPEASAAPMTTAIRNVRAGLDVIREVFGHRASDVQKAESDGDGSWDDLFPSAFQDSASEPTEADRSLVTKAAAREQIVDALLADPEPPIERRPWRGRGYR